MRTPHQSTLGFPAAHNERRQTLTTMRPHFEDVQAHYDLCDDFFAMFLDPTLTYSCAYFERDDMSLAEAQLAKIDLALGKLRLRPGMTVLDVGCGWGATMLRALTRHDVNVIGLTLSANQYDHVARKFDDLPSARSRSVLLRGWEEFQGCADRIVSIGAFEHFGYDRYSDFFEFAHRALPDDGSMLLHTIVTASAIEIRQRNLPMTLSVGRFAKFIQREIFPGGQLPSVECVAAHATSAGFRVARIQALRLHYVKTLECWAAALRSRKREAIAVQSEEVYHRYIRYLTGCAELFRAGYIDVCQFTLEKVQFNAPHQCTWSGTQ